jgi:hypothetical protein
MNGSAKRGAIFHDHSGIKIIEWRNMPPSYPLRFRVGSFNGKAFATIEECTEWIDAQIDR